MYLKTLLYILFIDLPLLYIIWGTPGTDCCLPQPERYRLLSSMQPHKSKIPWKCTWLKFIKCPLQNDRLVKIWYEDRKSKFQIFSAESQRVKFWRRSSQRAICKCCDNVKSDFVLFTDQYPLLRSDSIVSPKKEEQHYSFIYIAHPRAVTGFSWRKTSKYMPRYTDDIPIEWICNHILIVSQGKNFNCNEVAGIYFCCKVWKGEDSIWFFSSLTKFFKNWVIPLLKREKNELIR